MGAWIFKPIIDGINRSFAIDEAKRLARIQNNQEIKINKIEQGLIYKNPILSEFEKIKVKKGDLNNLINKMKMSPLIMVILGKRGSGKTAFAFRLLENLEVHTQRKCFVLDSLNTSLIPSWIYSIKDINDAENGSILLVDEAGIQFSSRRSMTKESVSLNDLFVISRHKGLSLIFISQNSAILDLNILRQADILFLKTPSLLQLDFERNAIKKIYEEVNSQFKKYKDKEQKKLIYIYDEEFTGIVSFKLASFWSEELSTSWANFKPTR